MDSETGCWKGNALDDLHGPSKFSHSLLVCQTGHPSVSVGVDSHIIAIVERLHEDVWVVSDV